MTDIVLDCDPGHDDAIALLLAAAADEIDLRAVTTVAGNHTLENTTRNARRLLTLIDRDDVPVGRGCAAPLTRELTIAEYVHGETGIDGPELPDPEVPLDDRHGVDLLVDAARAADGITLVPTGPLTNVAMALRKYPDLTDHVDEIVLMGGAVAEGNITPSAEFNVFVDPEAARVVFEADVPTTMVGLDVTHQARVGPDGIGDLRETSQVGSVVAELLDFAADYYRETHGWDAYPIHDAVAVAQVMDEGIVDTERMRVDVETRGEFTAGRTVCDVVGVVEDRVPNADVGLDLDRDRFVDLLLAELAKYD